ncbi:MAG: DUF4124 domain-containing protein [Burkholderiales bacterium]|jgi:hypothetical protein
MLKLLLLISLCLPLVASAQTQWSWRDAQGRVQFSDRPPPAGTPDKDILSRPASANARVQVVPVNQPVAAPASAPARPASSAVERSAANDKARKQREEEAKMKEQMQRQAELRAENCKSARQSIAVMQSGERVARMNEKGERVFMDDAERLEGLRRAQQVAASECK